MPLSARGIWCSEAKAVDSNANGATDFEIELTGTINLVAADFVL